MQLIIHIGLYYNDVLCPKNLPVLPTATFLVIEVLTPGNLAAANAEFARRAAEIGASAPLGDKASHMKNHRVVVAAARLVHGLRPAFAAARDLELQRTFDTLESHAWLYTSYQAQSGTWSDSEAAYMAALALELGRPEAKLFAKRKGNPYANTPLPEHLSMLLSRTAVLSLLQTVRPPHVVLLFLLTYARPSS
jgi:hypothetical protein